MSTGFFATWYSGVAGGIVEGMEQSLLTLLSELPGLQAARRRRARKAPVSQAKLDALAKARTAKAQMQAAAGKKEGNKVGPKKRGAKAGVRKGTAKKAGTAAAAKTTGAVA